MTNEQEWIVFTGGVILLLLFVFFIYRLAGFILNHISEKIYEGKRHSIIPKSDYVVDDDSEDLEHKKTIENAAYALMIGKSVRLRVLTNEDIDVKVNKIKEKFIETYINDIRDRIKIIRQTEGYPGRDVIDIKLQSKMEQLEQLEKK